MKFQITEKTKLLEAIFIAALISANLLGTKIAKIGFIEFSVGILAYPITFLITDILEEVHGEETVKRLVVSGGIALILVLLLTALSISLPFAERSLVKTEYNKVFHVSGFGTKS